MVWTLDEEPRPNSWEVYSVQIQNLVKCALKWRKLQLPAGAKSQVEGRNPSTADPSHFVVPVQKIHTCGGWIFEPLEMQATEESIIRMRVWSLPQIKEPKTSQQMRKQVPVGKESCKPIAVGLID